LLDDLQALPPTRWCVARYDMLSSEPAREIERLCSILGLEWDQPLDHPLPHSRHTVSAPDPGKWRLRADEIEAILPSIARTVERAESLAAPEYA
jgi:hypothetical protein